MLKNYTVKPELFCPTPPEKDGKTIQLDRMMPAPIDINQPQPKTMFKDSTYKAVYLLAKDTCRKAFQSAKKALMDTDAPSHINSTPYLNKETLKKFDEMHQQLDSKNTTKVYLEKVLGVDLTSEGSFDAHSISGDTDISDICAKNDSIEKEMVKRECLLNTFGLLAKITARKTALGAMDESSIKKHDDFIGRLNRNATKRNTKYQQRFSWLYAHKDSEVSNVAK